MERPISCSFAFLALILWSSFAYGQDCVWNKDLDYPVIPPVILDQNGNMVLPVMEGGNRIVRVSSGSRLSVACSGNVIVNLGAEAVEATCAGGTKLAVGGTEWDLRDLGCSDKVDEVIHRNLGTCGSGSVGDLHGIGFEISSSSSFYEVIRVCFEPAAETTLYTEHVLHGANIEAKDIDSSRPSFKTSTGFFSVSMSTVYAQDSQLQLMTDLLGDADYANSIIDPSKQLYFAKGHMSPDADFVTEAEQDATYYFINAVPQWQAFNNGNWKFLEYDTRDLSVLHGSDLTVYSGGFGVLELDDINNNPVEIYLGLYQDKMVVPAPAITWKVVHEKSTGRAAGIVGVNNPFLTSAPTKLCPDVCSQLSWITFDTSNLGSGYTYCCTVADLRAAIPHVPNIGNVGLLTD